LAVLLACFTKKNESSIVEIDRFANEAVSILFCSGKQNFHITDNYNVVFYLASVIVETNTDARFNAAFI